MIAKKSDDFLFFIFSLGRYCALDKTANQRKERPTEWSLTFVTQILSDAS